MFTVLNRLNLKPTIKAAHDYGKYPYITTPKEISGILKGVDFKVNKDGTVDIKGNIVCKKCNDLVDDSGHLQLNLVR